MKIDPGYKDFVVYDHFEAARRLRQIPQLPNTCPICRGQLTVRNLSRNSPIAKEWKFDGFCVVDTTLLRCRSCGWWCLEEFGEDLEDHRMGYGAIAIGVLKKWDVSTKDVPVAAVRAYLRSHQKSFAFKVLHPTTFERLIADCLRVEYAPCEVRHVGVAGGSGDGGIDLYLIKDGEEWLVQVKRRLTDSSEPIETIRLLNGVLLKTGKCKGLIVTSARTFSRNAPQETNILTPGPYEVRLVTGDDVIKMISAQSATHWEKIFSTIASQRSPWKKVFRSPAPVGNADLLPVELYSLFFDLGSVDVEGLKSIGYKRYAERLRERKEMLETIWEQISWVTAIMRIASDPTSPSVEEAAQTLQSMFENALAGQSILEFRSSAEHILSVVSKSNQALPPEVTNAFRYLD